MSDENSAAGVIDSYANSGVLYRFKGLGGVDRAGLQLGVTESDPSRVQMSGRGRYGTASSLTRPREVL